MKEVQNALDKENRKYFANEVDNLKSLSHPNIVTLYESVLWKDNIYMFLEYVQGGDLKSKIEACVKLSEETCKCIVYQIAMALQYLHSLSKTLIFFFFVLWKNGLKGEKITQLSMSVEQSHNIGKFVF